MGQKLGRVPFKDLSFKIFLFFILLVCTVTYAIASSLFIYATSENPGKQKIETWKDPVLNINLQK